MNWNLEKNQFKTKEPIKNLEKLLNGSQSKTITIKYKIYKIPILIKKRYFLKTDPNSQYYIISSKENNSFKSILIKIRYKGNEKIAHIGNISNMPLYKASGNIVMEIVDLMLEHLGIKEVFLQDAAVYMCKHDKTEMEVAFYKLMISSSTWYQKFGFDFDKDNINYLIDNDYKKTIDHFMKYLNLLQNLEVGTFYDELVSFRNFILFIINKGQYSQIRMAVDRFKYKNDVIDITNEYYISVMRDICNEYVSNLSVVIDALRNVLEPKNPEVQYSSDKDKKKLFSKNLFIGGGKIKIDKKWTLQKMIKYLIFEDCKKYNDIFDILLYNNIYHWLYRNQTYSIIYTDGKKHTLLTMKFARYIEEIGNIFSEGIVMRKTYY